MNGRIKLLNTKVEIQPENGLDSAINITDITQATEAVITVTNTYSDGDIVLISGVVGMTQINQTLVKVKSATATEFVATGIDSTNFTAYTSGGTAEKVSTWQPFSNVTSVSIPEPAPNELDTTTVHDTTKQEEFGLDEAMTITLDMFADPFDPAVIELRASSKAKDYRAFRVTLQDEVTHMIGLVSCSGGRGLDGAAGDTASSSATLKVKGYEQWFNA